MSSLRFVRVQISLSLLSYVDRIQVREFSIEPEGDEGRANLAIGNQLCRSAQRELSGHAYESVGHRLIPSFSHVVAHFVLGR